MVKLLERALVKDLLGIARADTLQDPIINGMIEQVSEDAEVFCRRSFTKETRTEYYPSYDQEFADPTPQFVWLDGPIDLNEPLTVTWALYDLHDSAGFTLTPSDYRVDTSKGRNVLIINGSSGVITALLPIGAGRPLYQYSPTGFRVTYTGGYPLSVKGETDPVDPIDDFGVTQVPQGLKNLLAEKVAKDYTNKKMVQTWSKDEIARLASWIKMDRV